MGLPFVGITFLSTAQKKEKAKEPVETSSKISKDKDAEVLKYRRSSLHTIIIEDEKLPSKDLIVATFNDAEFPSKYNNHTVGAKSFNVADYLTTPAIGEQAEGGSVKPKELAPVIERHFEKNKVANKLVAKWFGQDADGAFDMSLIQERGLYDASAQDMSMALSTERGKAVLADAGEDLIKKTFVVVNYSKFVSNEVTAGIVRASAYLTAEALPGLAATLAKTAADILYAKTKDGYSVWTTAYLYQLDWNEEAAATFYQSHWMDKSSVDASKKEAFENSDIFKLKLLGFQKASALVTGMGQNEDDDDLSGKDNLIKGATLKSVDAVYAKLQKNFESFRTKSPLVSTNPIGAKIGMKEGVKAGSKFEVLEKVITADGKITYKRKGIIKAAKGKIMDNRSGLIDAEGNTTDPENKFEFTTFKGSKGFYPGMLIRQLN